MPRIAGAPSLAVMHSDAAKVSWLRRTVLRSHYAVVVGDVFPLKHSSCTQIVIKSLQQLSSHQ